MPSTVIGQVHQVEEEDGMLVVKAGCNDDVVLDTGVVRVNNDRVTLCPMELPDTSWLSSKRSHKSRKKQ